MSSALFALACGFGAIAAATPPPNFLILFADDMGFSQPSFRSGDGGTISTPHLDKLAAESATFDNWYSGSQICSPSRASLMTGRLPIRVGIGTNGDVFMTAAAGGLPRNETTIAELLSPAYSTALIGKWHLGQRAQFLPRNHGFEQYLGIPFSADNGISSWLFSNESFGPGAEAQYHQTPLPLMRGEKPEMEDVLEQPVDLSELTQRYVEYGQAFMGNASASQKPFLLVMAFTHVHAPNFSGEKFCGSSKRGPVGDAAQEMDDAVGQLLGYLHAQGLSNNTVVFFSSDNGAPLDNDCIGNLGLRDGKFTTWEGGVKVGGMVRWPGKIKPARMPEIAATYDIFPTVAAMAGRQVPEGTTLDGIDLSPLLLGTAQSGEGGHECVMLYHWQCYGKGSKLQNACHMPLPGPKGVTGAVVNGVPTGIAAVRCGKYKMHYATIDSPGAVTCGSGGVYPAGNHDPPLLFDLSKDAHESDPMEASSPIYRAVEAKMTAAMEAHVATLERVPDQMVNNDPPRELAHAWAVCKAPRSQEKYPMWPNCTYTPQNFFRPKCAHHCVQTKGESLANPTCLCYGRDAHNPFCHNETAHA